MLISKVCTQIKARKPVPWHWNSVNEASMLLPKGVSKNLQKQCFWDCLWLSHPNYDSWFTANFGKSINLKTRDNPFLFI